MKLHFRRVAIMALLAVIAFFVAPLSAGAAIVTGAAALAVPLLNFNPAPFLLASSYDRVNTTTSSNLTTENAKAKEELWVNRILLGSENLYQSCPLAEPVFLGRIQPGGKANDRILQKAIVELMDLSKVRGSTINVTTYAGLGGPGAFGEGDRVGKEQKMHTGTFPVTIGRAWFGVGYTSVARDETMIGGVLDKRINDALRYLHTKKRNDDHLMRFRQAVATGVGTNNLIYPEGHVSDATLISSAVLSTDLISNAGQVLPGFGAIPVDTTTDSGGSVGEKFILLASDYGLRPVKVEPAYLNAQVHAGDRGDGNRVFRGDYSMWDGHVLYNWIHRDHANKGPIGSPLLPRAKLGYALTSADTNSIVHGGGLVCGATVDNSTATNANTGDTTDGPAPLYLEFFKGSPYTFYNGDTIAAEETALKYIRITNSNGNYSVYSYKVCNGKALIIFARVLDSGASYTHAKGALIEECNILGQALGYSVMLGAEAIACGMGSIDGNTVGALGRRTEEHRNHDMDHGIGAEGVWGNACVKRAGDGAYPNFLLIRHAIQRQGAPVITG